MVADRRMTTDKQTPFHALRFTGSLILILYLVLALAYGVMAPPFESPDEVGHFFTVKYIADYGQLPAPEKGLS